MLESRRASDRAFRRWPGPGMTDSKQNKSSPDTEQLTQASAPRRRGFRWLGFGAAALVLAFAGASACSRPVTHHLLDTVMACAHRPSGPCSTALIAEKPGQQPQRYELLAGDMHCHVSPPDRPPHVTRGIEETVALAHDENLDFVVLTPHVRAPFFMSPSRRERSEERRVGKECRSRWSPYH